MTEKRSFRKAMMQGPCGYYVTANLYCYGGDAEITEGAIVGDRVTWMGFVGKSLEVETDDEIGRVVPTEELNTNG